jgi:hypothetical protein
MNSKPDWGNYFENLGVCPYCQADNLEGQSFEDGSQDVLCLSCGNTWTDCYTLSSVVTDDGRTVRTKEKLARAKAPELLECLRKLLDEVSFGTPSIGTVAKGCALIAEIEDLVPDTSVSA